MNLLREMFEAAKIHVQIMRFTCCLTKPVLALICLHDVTQESVAALNDHFPMLFFTKMLRASMTLWQRYNFQKFDADANVNAWKNMCDPYIHL